MRSLFLFAIVAGLGVLVPTHDAVAGKCEKLQGPDRRECQKSQVAKWNKSRTPYKPSRLAPTLGMLDADNPLNRYRWYVGIPKPTGFADVDKTVRNVAKVEATVNLGKYALHLNERGKNERAVKVAKALVPVMGEVSGSVSQITASAQKINPTAMIKKDPLGAPRATKLLGESTAKLPRLSKDLVTLTRDVGALAASGTKTAVSNLDQAPQALRQGAKQALDGETPSVEKATRGGSR